MTPTIGRIVQYSPGTARDDSLRWYAAIVTYVVGDGCVCLTVFPPGGVAVSASNVTAVPDDLPEDAVPEIAGWRWPPVVR